MGQREKNTARVEIHRIIDCISGELPNKRTLGMSRAEFEPIRAFYSLYGQLRKTWLPPNSRLPSSPFLAQSHALVARLRRVEIPPEFSTLCEALFRLAPVLMDDSNNWKPFRDVMESIRALFTENGTTLDLYASKSNAHLKPEDERRRAALMRFHRVVVEPFVLQVEKPFERSVLSVLFHLARRVIGRKRWKVPLNQWEHAVRVAQRITYQPIWATRPRLTRSSKNPTAPPIREILIEARRQLKMRSPIARINRTLIKEKARHIYSIYGLYIGRLQRDSSFDDELLQDINWEAYMNKLPSRLFPKKGRLRKKCRLG